MTFVLTDVTFGFDTAVNTATEAIDKLHTTAKSHDRVMVVEVMGRYVGWIALHSGISGSADVILIPEIPYDIDKVCNRIRQLELLGQDHAIVVVSEGAKPVGGDITVAEGKQSGCEVRLGGVGKKVADEIGQRTGKETRHIVLRSLAERRRSHYIRQTPVAQVWSCCGEVCRSRQVRHDGSCSVNGNRRSPYRRCNRPDKISAHGFGYTHNRAVFGDKFRRLKRKHETSNFPEVITLITGCFPIPLSSSSYPPAADLKAQGAPRWQDA